MSGIPCKMGLESAQRSQWKLVPILVIIDVEMPREAGTCEMRFGPATVRQDRVAREWRANVRRDRKSHPHRGRRAERPEIAAPRP